MSKVLVWYQLFLKVYLKKRSTWIQLAGMLLLVIFILSIHIPDGKNMSAGFCTSGNAMAEQVLEQLVEEDSAFEFIPYDTVEELREDVKSQRLECGFVTEQDFESNVMKGDMNDCVRYICTPMTSKGEVMKETFYAAFFQIYSDELLKSKEEMFFGNKDPQRQDNWMQINHELRQSSEIFQVEYCEVESTVEKQEEHITYPVQGVVGLMILLILFLSYGRRFEPGKMAVEKAMMRGERFLYSCAGMLAAGTIPALAGVILVISNPGNRGVCKEVAAMLVYLLWAAVWVWLVGRLQRSIEGQISFLLSILVMNVLLCPIFFDLSECVPAIQYIKYISPLGLYLGNVW